MGRERATAFPKVRKLTLTGWGLLCAALVWASGCPSVMPGDGNGGAGGGGGGADTGTLTGQVTNAATEAALTDASVTLDPEVDGADLGLDTSGRFSASVPTGVYTLTVSRAGFESGTRTVNVDAGAVTTANVALVASAPVLVSASVTGDAAPGGNVTVTASVEILDGTTTVQGYSWAQANSVDVQISNGTSQTATVTLPGVAAYKDQLIEVLAEPPVTQEQLPPTVVIPEGEFPGGLQNRFYVVGLNPFALEETGLVTLTVTVTTSSGTYSQDVAVHAELPWKVTTGVHTVPVGIPVLLHGKTQDAYDWSLATPGGSSAALTDGSTQNPYFTPDVGGTYTVTVTDNTVDPAADVELTIYAGTWQGVITGQDADGRPLAANCTVCHNDTVAPDMFTPWAQTGHAEIFTDNLNTSTHYGESCFACHTVGFDPGTDNEGIDEVSDYQAFLDAGLLNNPGDNWTTVLADFPETARMANIQCENCHGPQNGSSAHMAGEPRISISSDLCGSCHGEPLRHARFQQWQLSGHANYELAIDEGGNGNCARCHSGNGFLKWLPILLDDDPSTDPLDDVEVTWSTDDTHPQTCVACHDPHNIGTTTGEGTNARVRIAGDTPPLIAGFQVFGAGRGAICMTCHNSRRGIRNDANFDDFFGTGEAARAPHGSAQTDVLMGENAFLVEVGIRGSHSLIEDTCVTCHMAATPPPDVLAYEQGGTNHTFFASPDICAECHEELTADGVQTAYEASSSELKALIENAMLDLIAEQIAAGNRIDVGGQATVTSASDIDGLEFGESHGRQAITVTLDDGTTLDPAALSDVLVLDGGGAELGPLYDFADPRLIKAGWNWNLGANDGSRGVHNPPFVFAFLDAGIDALNELAAE